MCMLFKDGAGYSCSVKISSPMADDDYDTSEFMKQDIYEISFCHNQVDGVQICKALTEKFKPYRNGEKHTGLSVSVVSPNTSYKFRKI